MPQPMRTSELQSITSGQLTEEERLRFRVQNYLIKTNLSMERFSSVIGCSSLDAQNFMTGEGFSGHFYTLALEYLEENDPISFSLINKKNPGHLTVDTSGMNMGIGMDVNVDMESDSRKRGSPYKMSPTSNSVQAKLVPPEMVSIASAFSSATIQQSTALQQPFSTYQDLGLGDLNLLQHQYTRYAGQNHFTSLTKIQSSEFNEDNGRNHKKKRSNST